MLIRPIKPEVPQSADFSVFRKPFDPQLLNAAHRAVKVGSVPNPRAFAGEGTWPQQVRQMMIKKNLHGDQLQNLRGENAYECDHSYICSNTLSTIFFDQTFDVSEAIDLADKRSQPVNLYDC